MQFFVRYILSVLYTIVWVILFINILYYFNLNYFESQVIKNNLDFVFDSIILLLRPIFVGLPKEERDALRMNPTVPKHTDPLPSKSSWTNSFGLMKIIMIVCVCIILFSVMGSYIYYGKKDQSLVGVILIGIIVAGTVTLVEAAYASIITTHFYGINTGLLLNSVISEFDEQLNCRTSIATAENCEKVCIDSNSYELCGDGSWLCDNYKCNANVLPPDIPCIKGTGNEKVSCN
jgi:hypothetical protein